MAEKIEKFYKSFIKSLNKTNPKALNEFNINAYKKLSEPGKAFYKKAVPTIAYALVTTHTLDPKFKKILTAKGVTLSSLAKYITITTFAAPYANAKSEKVKSALVQGLTNLQQSITDIRNAADKNKVQKEAFLLTENIFTKPFQLIKKAAWYITKSVLFFAAATVNFVNQVISSIAYPLKAIPGGELIVSQFMSFVLMTQSPVIIGVYSVAKILTKPEVKQASDLAMSVFDGSLTKELDKIFADIEKDLDFGDLDDESKPSDDKESKTSENDDDDLF